MSRCDVKTLSVRGVTLGDGAPKIAVPLVGRTRRELLAEAAAVMALPADVAEWRADFYEALGDEDALLETLRALRAALGERALLFTVRTRREGGAADADAARYAALTLFAARSGCVDLADVELSVGEAAARELIAGVRAAGCYSVGSRHDFAATPPRETMLAYLREARSLGADVPKLAVMANCDADALALLEAAAAFRAEADRPYIAISMGRFGVLSRVACRLSGSCLTFGAAEKASAPGQLPAGELKRILELL